MIDARRWFEGFDVIRVETGEATVAARVGGNPDRPALVLLHGFPQTHAMWHRVARHLEQRFHLVLPDLRGYGDSSKHPGGERHEHYSKRAMAGDVIAVMQQLGHDRFSVCGHDRGGRVAHRLALDHADHVERVCVIDIAPTLDMYARSDMGFARAYYHWFFFIQPSPLPERLIAGDPSWYLTTLLGGWGSAGFGHIEPEALADYQRCFTPEAIHAMCEDYRASAGIDLDHDRASRDGAQRIACDLHVLWGTEGVIERFFDPIGLWAAQCSGTVTGKAMAAGHFLPEQLAAETADELEAFFG